MSDETKSEAAAVRLTDGGPYIVTGAMVIDKDGKLLKSPSEKCALCACGKSDAKPFCDGSHAKP